MRIWNRNPDILQVARLIQKVPPRKVFTTFMVKATYRLKPGAPLEPLGPTDPLLVKFGVAKPEHMPDLPAGDALLSPPADAEAIPLGALRTANELVPFKPKADVLFAGSAHAPGGKPVESLRVGFRWGEKAKMLVVLGDHGLLDGKPTAVKPFTSLRLGWDRAWGGPGFAQNPAGLGAVEYQLDDGRRWRPLPNIQDPAAPVSDLSRAHMPVGFGPYAADWPQRSEGKMGTYDQKWLDTQWPWYPADFDWSHYNAAPADQQVDGYLRGDELLGFENLHPENPNFTVRLPGLRAKLFFKDYVDAPPLDERDMDAPGAEPEDGPAPADVAEPAEEKPGTMIQSLGVTLPAAPDMDAFLKGMDEAGDRAAAAKRAELRAKRKPRPTPEPEPEYRWREVKLVLDTLTVDMDAGKVTLVWRGQAKARSLKLREIGDLLVLAEPLTEPQHPPEHYLAMLEAMKAERKKVFRPEGKEPFDPDKLEEKVKTEVARGKAKLDYAKAFMADQKTKFEGAATEIKAKAEEKRVALGAPVPEPRTESPLDPHLRKAIDEIAKTDPERAKAIEGELPVLKPGAPPEASAAYRQGMELKARLEKERDETLAKINAAMEPHFGKLSGERFETRAALEEALAKGADLRAMKAMELDLSGMDFSGRDLRRAGFMDCDLTGANFSGADLSNASFLNAKVVKADFSGATLDRAGFTRAEVDGARFAGASLTMVAFGEQNLAGCDLSRTRGKMATFNKTDLTGASFAGAELQTPSFLQAKIEGADFTGARINKAVFFAVKAAGIILRDAEIVGLCAIKRCDFSRGNFERLTAIKANLEQAILTGANFRRATLTGSMLCEVMAEGADFDRARLEGVNLEEAVLRRARVTNANLLRARLDRTDLTRCDLGGSNLYRALVIHCILEETAVHGTNLKGTLLHREEVVS